MADADRTEQPTDKREREFRERGQVAMSRDAATVAGLAGALLVGQLSLSGTFSALSEGLAAGLRRTATPGVVLADGRGLLVDAGWQVARGCAAVVLAAGFLGTAITLAQTRFNVSWKSLAPDWSRVDPSRGLGRLFSLRAAFEAMKGLAKVLLLAIAAGLVMGPWAVALPGRLNQPLGVTLADFGDAVSGMIKVTCLLLGALAAADYGFQWWQLQKQKRMTRQEVLDEHKDAEGSPQLKGRRRQAHRSMVTGNRLIQAIAAADVVVTNPDHVAVALAYVLGRHRAPVVTAMGVDARAEQIKRLARDRGIPRVENRPLARALCATAEEGREIPEKLYQAVAEVMAFVHRVRGLRGDRRQGATR